MFPYFVERLGLSKVSQWNQDIVDKWESFICENIKEASSRNRKRTALRRYFKFLKRTGEIKVIPQIFDEAVKRNTKETIIPGDLPRWRNVVSWLRSLPAGRYRFIRVICMGFGLRISEAFMVEEEDFFGMESVDHISSRNDFISRIIDKKVGALFLYVNKAHKKKVSREIIRTLGDQDNEPKTGPYTACCTSFELANFIVEMINNGEHLEELKNDEIYRVIYNLPVDKSAYKFNQYRPHDDRRLNITLQCLDLSMNINDVVEICTLLHGQSSREVFGRYLQWGLTQRRKQGLRSGRKLAIFKT